MSAIPERRPLGRTGLQVSPLGIGGGAGISSDDVLHAYDQGINYFFFSSDLHHFLYTHMAAALRTLCGRGSAERQNVVLAVVTYVTRPEKAMGALFDQFSELGIDYVDAFYWGWLGAGDRAVARQLLAVTPHLRGPDAHAARFVEEAFGVSERLRAYGAVRSVGASFHDVTLAAEWAGSPLLDHVMVRHNPAHRGAQRALPLALPPEGARPGVVTFKSTHGAGVPLWKRPAHAAAEAWVPSPGHLYRYSLSQPWVDLCLTGPRTRSDIDAALAAVRLGTLSTYELATLDAYGDALREARAAAPTRASSGTAPLHARSDAPVCPAVPSGIRS